MRLWLNRSSEVSLRDQLITQVRLGILCRELKPAERLPSTRELARRFGIHANTASAAYKELEAAGWLEFRHGSGVYVRASRPAPSQTPELMADELIGELAVRARKLRVPHHVVRDRLLRWLRMEPPARWLVIEPDPDLCAIVIAEMEPALSLPVTGCAPADCAQPGILEGAMPAVLPSKAAMVRKLLPPGLELTVLEVHPVSPALQSKMQQYLPEHGTDLIGIASRWAEFQVVARIMLVAAGLPPQSLLVRDARKPGWKRGLSATSGVVCDAVTAAELPRGCFPLAFKLLSDATLASLREAEIALTATAAI